MNQIVMEEKIDYLQLEKILTDYEAENIFVVCGESAKSSYILEYLKKSKRQVFYFSEYSANPDYEDVRKGVTKFIDEKCNVLLAIGGGSALDVAKCIKLFNGSGIKMNYLNQQYKENGIPLIAIPTTAGTGSEATKFAVIYKEGTKISVEHDSMLPERVILDAELLVSLPDYQKKSTLFDALSQAIEAWWSINSTETSVFYSQKAIELICENMDEYLAGNHEADKHILRAANYSGKAINIARTTAPHAMSYKLTTLYGITHGHAVGICLPIVWDYMYNHMDMCTDKRGKDYLENTFSQIAHSFGTASCIAAIRKLRELIDKYEFSIPKLQNLQELQELVNSVNIERLSNNPIRINRTVLEKLYLKLLSEGK